LRYGRATSLLRGLGLFNPHRALWFVGLLAALVLNTLACTLQRLPRLWRSLSRPPVVVRPDAFYLGFAHRAEWPLPSLRDGLTMAQSALAQRRYRVRVEHKEGSAYLYAERGRWGQASTAVSHVAAILLVLAVIARPALAWQDADVTLLPGQVHQVGHGHDLAIRAGSLTIDRHPGDEPRDYRVPLTVLIHDSPRMTRTVRINHPFTFQGVAFHLQGYGPAAQVTTPERTLDLAFVGGQTQEVALPEAGLTLRAAHQPIEGALFVEVLDADGVLLGSGIVAHGQEIEVQGTSITFSLGLYTVWQVSRDPTFGLAVGAAALLLAAAVVSFCVPHRRLWLRMDPQQARMVGVGDFDGAFNALANELSQTSNLSGPDSARSGFGNRPGAILDPPSSGKEEGGTSG
jgi:cytochrome c biogenesis protein